MILYVRDYGSRYQFSGNRGKKVVLYLLTVHYIMVQGYELTFRNKPNDSFGNLEVFCLNYLCTSGSLAIYAQVHH